MKPFRTDFTYTMVGRIQELSRPALASGVYARALSSEELLELSEDPKYDLSNSAVEGVVDNNDKHCFATFNNGVVSAYIFFATSIVGPEINTAGAGFGGIGMRLPNNVLYIYKGFSLPDYRGQRQVNIAVAAGADALANQRGWMVSTVEIDNASSIKMLENVGLKRQDQFREYRLFGKGKYQIPDAIQLGAVDADDRQRVEIFTPA